jgi:hypothetical protein
MLIASGSPGDDFHDHLLARLPRAPQIAWIGAASGDRAQWFERSANLLGKRYDARVRLARTVPGPGYDREETRRILDEAQLIYLGGGDVSLLAEHLCRDGLDEQIRARRRAGAALLGVSAGAIGLTPAWLRFPEDIDDDEDNSGEVALPSRFACVGAVPIACDVHDEESDWEELRALLDVWRRDDPQARVEAYGIPAGGALLLDGEDRVKHLGAAPHRLILDQGRIVE